MRTIDYKPEQHFNGVVKIKMPKFKDRMEIIKGLGLNVSADKEVEINDDAVDKATQMINIAHDHVEAVEVKHIESGEKFTNLDELEYYEEGIQLIQKIAGVVINGVRLGKPSKEN